MVSVKFIQITAFAMIFTVVMIAQHLLLHVLTIVPVTMVSAILETAVVHLISQETTAASQHLAPRSAILMEIALMAHATAMLAIQELIALSSHLLSVTKHALMVFVISQ